MPFRVFTLQCNEDGVFDDADLHTFSQEHQVLTCSKDFYFHRNEPKMVEGGIGASAMLAHRL